MDASEQPLASLFDEALKNASKAHDLPTVDDATQSLLSNALSGLKTVWSRVLSLGLFSDNESVDDVATKDMAYILVPFLSTEIQGRLRTHDAQERLVQLLKSQEMLAVFFTLVSNYDLIPEDELLLHQLEGNNASSDPSRRRERKIKQYKKEKEIRAQVEPTRHRQQSPASGSADDSSNHFDLVSTLLSSVSDEEREDEVRRLTALLIRLTWAQAKANGESLAQEAELLRSMPSQDLQTEGAVTPDDSWRLDPVSSPRGPLLSAQGKPLRPFTLLPAGSSSDRSRIQSEVFRPDHRLPTMNIDEYLAEEQRRGNVITGGGPQSANQMTRSEQLTLDAELDGSSQGQAALEKKRREDEEWARYTDDNPKGMGNTMNRG